MVFTAWLLLSCRAEDLGISIPPKGREGITQEDLQRDLYLAQNTPDTSWLVERMKQMGLSAYEEERGLCFGTHQKKRVVAVIGESLSASLGQVVLVSLAKAMHKTQQSFDLCVYKEAPTDKEWWLKDMSGGDFVFQGNEVSTRAPVQDAASMDFRLFRDEVKNFAGLLGIP